MDSFSIGVIAAAVTLLWLVIWHYEDRVEDLQSRLDAALGDYPEPMRASMARHPGNQAGTP